MSSPSSSSSSSSSTKKSKQQPICIFHMRGACKKGSDCKFAHSSPSAQDLVLCKYHITNSCRYGQYCQLTHGLLCEFCNTNSLHPHNEKQAQQHTKMCEEKSALLKKLPPEVQEATRTVECGICLDVISSKGNRFGLMTGCDHAFCITCIRMWRSKANDNTNSSAMVKSCPTCRKESLFIIPSLIYCTGEIKKCMIEQYKDNLKTKSCRYFAKAGSCPFGADCFYAHYNADGTLADTSGMRNIIKNSRRSPDYRYEVDVVNLLSHLTHMSPSYVMDVLMDMLGDDGDDWDPY